MNKHLNLEKVLLVVTVCAPSEFNEYASLIGSVVYVRIWRLSFFKKRKKNRGLAP